MNAYQQLCDVADVVGASVKLTREAERGWGLSITVPPAFAAEAWRASGFLFPAVEELPRHAEVALEWLRGVRPHAGPTKGD